MQAQQAAVPYIAQISALILQWLHIPAVQQPGDVTPEIYLHIETTARLAQLLAVTLIFSSSLYFLGLRRLNVTVAAAAYPNSPVTAQDAAAASAAMHLAGIALGERRLRLFVFAPNHSHPSLAPSHS